jgi:hypothetical protein
MKEAGAGIEPANRGFADPDLTTWLPRPLNANGEYEGRIAVSIWPRLPAFNSLLAKHSELDSLPAVALRRRVGRWTFPIR